MRMQALDEETIDGTAEQAETSETALRAELEESRAAERAAVERLRAALVATDPGLDDTLVTGATLGEVEESYQRAAAMLARVRESLAREGASRVPAGAPGRASSHPRTAFEKIRDGLGHRVK